MIDPQQPIDRLAAGLLHIAQQRLLRDYPFHARFVATWDVQASEAVRTMGVTVRGEAIFLLFNPEFVCSCSLEELGGVLHHEVNHLLFGHLFLNPADYPDHRALVIAEEVTVNEWIREPLPGAPLLLEQFPQLSPDEDTQTRYHRLAKKGLEADASSSQGQKPDQTGQKLAPSAPNSVPPVPKVASSEPLSALPHPLDDHDIWHHAQAAGVLGQMAVHVQIREVAERLSAAAWQQLPSAVQHRVQTLCRGDTPGSSRQALFPHGAGHVDWRRLLRQYVREATEIQPMFTRPSRRFPDLVGIVPGYLHRPTRPTVMAVIDTSSSLSTDMLAMIAAELAHLAASHTMTVVECDARVHAVYRYRGRLNAVHGRGGTDLRPPFAQAILRHVRPDIVVYFTDGDGPAPAGAPTVPVIWCLIPGGTQPAPWGHVVHLPPA